jgi:Ca2+/Na+ antiporter
MGHSGIITIGQLLLIVLGLAAIVALLAIKGNEKMSRRGKITISALLLGVVIFVVLRVTALNSQLAQGLTVLATLALAFAAFYTIEKSKAQAIKLIQANRTDQQNTRKSELLDEVTDWINLIVKETYEPTTLTNIWDSLEESILKKIDSADMRRLLDTRNRKQYEKEHMVLSALLAQEKYMLNIARYFKYEETLTRFITAASGYKEMIASLSAKARESINSNDKHLENELAQILGAQILLTRSEAEASLIGLSQIKINSLYITD